MYICRRIYESKVKGCYIPLKFKNNIISKTNSSYYYIRESIPKGYIYESQDNIVIMRQMYKELM